MNILEAFKASNRKEIKRLESGVWIIKRYSSGEIFQIHKNDLFAEDWEPINEPEPTFKEVTMYASILRANGEVFISFLYSSVNECLQRDSAIGYKEVTVFLKNEGEE